MKKLLPVALATLLFTFCGCDTVVSVGNGSTTPPSGNEQTQTPSNPSHEHSYIELSRVEPTCTESGSSTKKCSCGATKKETLAPLGHRYGDPTETKIKPCANEGCHSALLPTKSGKYVERMQCVYDENYRRDIEDAYTALIELLDGVGGYQNQAYSTSSSLYTKNQEFERGVEEYYAMVDELGVQYQYAQIEYHVEFSSAEKEATYLDASEFYFTSYNDYSGLYQKAYDSALRNYFYHDYTQTEIDETLAEFNGGSNAEVLRLQTENDRLIVDYYNIADVEQGTQVPKLYAQIVENNDRIAEIYGYDHYMEYAYAQEYDREYDTLTSAEFFEDAKNHLSPLLNDYWNELYYAEQSLTAEDELLFEEIYSDSFFENSFVNALGYDFMKNLVAEKSGGNLSYQDEMSALFTNGNYFLGEYEGAYEWYIPTENIPVLYFGGEYKDLFTVTHEFGHYMNDRYNHGEGCQSYDLMETHSQGLEVLLLGSLKKTLSPTAYEYLKINKMLDYLFTVLNAGCVDAFEQAVYAGNYTYSQYDDLYTDILAEAGIDDLVTSAYWRYVVLDSAGYYISYAVSMACSLQLLSLAESNLSGAVEKYLYLVENGQKANATYKSLLTGAGLYAYDDLRLFNAIA